ncbi:MAG: hypothetical protein IJ297_08065 [Clostridia bacterium]|nr:hypothetical protein [Clostridia bacterium]
MITIKHILSVLLALTIIFSAFPVIAETDYDEVGIYWECYTLYPDFVDNVKFYNVNDNQIIRFLGYVEAHLLTREEELSEENFDQYMFDAINYAFGMRPCIPVRDALAKAYPDAVGDAMNAVVPEEYMPIYETVKRYLFGIKSPIITASVVQGESDATFYAHSVNLPENSRLTLALYDEEGVLLHAEAFTPNCAKEDEIGFMCSCSVHSVKVFAWEDGSLSPICESYEIIIE